LNQDYSKFTLNLKKARIKFFRSFVYGEDLLFLTVLMIAVFSGDNQIDLVEKHTAF